MSRNCFFLKAGVMNSIRATHCSNKETKQAKNHSTLNLAKKRNYIVLLFATEITRC